MQQEKISNLLQDSNRLNRHFLKVIFEKQKAEQIFTSENYNFYDASSVLFLIGYNRSNKNRFSSEPCIILNKRSSLVGQPGDLCFPGGSIKPRLDLFLKKLLYLPFSPLTKWHYWSFWKNKCLKEADKLAFLLATSLRESFEEMRLNPMAVNFLGPISAEYLQTSNKMIYPMVCWVSGQKKFFPNWEVEKILYIPIYEFFNKQNYYRFKIDIDPEVQKQFDNLEIDHPCFICKTDNQTDLLWGATYRIIASFLELAFKFKMPDIELLPFTNENINRKYFSINKKNS